MDAMISVRNFSKSYGTIQAVNAIDFEVGRGELFGLIGPDGAGKTTTMRTLVTLLPLKSGEIFLNNFNVAKDTLSVRNIVGYMPQRFSLYPDLSIDQNLNFFAELFGVPKEEIAPKKKRLYQFSRLEEFSDRLAGRLSGGMKQKLALSCTLIHDPLILILDEPTTGVDPVSRNEFWTLLSELTSQGVTILVSTPYMDEALKCDRVVVMHEGRILAQGAPSGLSALFPDHLYQLKGTTGMINPNRIRELSGVVSVHSFGDSLHVAVLPTLTEINFNIMLQKIFDDNFSLRRITPSLEDIFINLIVETHGN